MITDSVVMNSGVKLQYVDTGAPSKAPYTTLFAIHGMCFTSTIFEKVQRVAFARGMRLVAITRRNFPGSTPYTAEETSVVNDGSTEAKDAWMEARGHEIATLISTFVKDKNLPPLSKDGKKGGIAILGWSVGGPFAIAAVSSAATLPAEIRDRFASNMRALLLHEPASITLGMPMPPKNWLPLIDTSIPSELQYPAFAQWITSYFDHGDLSTRSVDVLSYVLPSAFRPPSYFTLDPKVLKDGLVLDDKTLFDMGFLYGMQDPLKKAYRAACFDPATRRLFGRMKVTLISGDRAPAWGPAVMWDVQDDEKQLGKEGCVVYKWVRDGNHFMHCDEPERMVDVYEECMML